MEQARELLLPPFPLPTPRPFCDDDVLISTVFFLGLVRPLHQFLGVRCPSFVLHRSGPTMRLLRSSMPILWLSPSQAGLLSRQSTEVSHFSCLLLLVLRVYGYGEFAAPRTPGRLDVALLTSLWSRHPSNFSKLNPKPTDALV
jgi:hypothetical protein